MLIRQILNKALLDIAPPAIVYVSCNPASLARDGQMLCEDGQHKLVSCQPIDMFPQTNHVESVARFKRVQIRGQSDKGSVRLNDYDKGSVRLNDYVIAIRGQSA